MSTLNTMEHASWQYNDQASKPKVFVVDDDISVRESLEPLIRHEGFEVESFSCANSFLTRASLEGPGCMLLDVALPNMTGLELQQAMIVEMPAMPIIFITGREDVPTIVQAMKSGAVEFLMKPLHVVKLLDAIRMAVARSEILLQQQQRKASLNRRYQGLTKRERQVFAMVLEGFLNREIAGKLDISEITVKAHRGQVMRKMAAQSLAELFRMANDIGL